MAYDPVGVDYNIRMRMHNQCLARYDNKKDLYRCWMFEEKPYWLICDLALEMGVDFMQAIESWENIGRIINKEFPHALVR